MKKLKGVFALALSCLVLLGSASTVHAGKWCDTWGHNYKSAGYNMENFGPDEQYCFVKVYFTKEVCATCGAENPTGQFHHQDRRAHNYASIDGRGKCTYCGYILK